MSNETTINTQSQLDALAAMEHECPDSPKACWKYHVRTPLFPSLRRDCDCDGVRVSCDNCEEAEEHVWGDPEYSCLVCEGKGWLPVEVGDVDLNALLMEATSFGVFELQVSKDETTVLVHIAAVKIPFLGEASTPVEAVIDAISQAVKE